MKMVKMPNQLRKKSLIAYLTNKGNLYTTETISFSTQKRGGKGAKVKIT